MSSVLVGNVIKKEAIEMIHFYEKDGKYWVLGNNHSALGIIIKLTGSKISIDKDVTYYEVVFLPGWNIVDYKTACEIKGINI